MGWLPSPTLVTPEACGQRAELAQAAAGILCKSCSPMASCLHDVSGCFRAGQPAFQGSREAAVDLKARTELRVASEPGHMMDQLSWAQTRRGGKGVHEESSVAKGTSIKTGGTGSRTCGGPRMTAAGRARGREVPAEPCSPRMPTQGTGSSLDTEKFQKVFELGNARGSCALGPLKKQPGVVQMRD